MRNRIGALGQERLIRCILSCMAVQNISYQWAENISGKFPWYDQSDNDLDIERRMKALCWQTAAGKKAAACFQYEHFHSPEKCGYLPVRFRCSRIPKWKNRF